jgi:hypothetical protein
MAHKVLAWFKRAEEESAMRLGAIEIEGALERDAVVTFSYRGRPEVGRIFEIQHARQRMQGDLPRVIIKQSPDE